MKLAESRAGKPISNFKSQVRQFDYRPIKYNEVSVIWMLF